MGYVLSLIAATGKPICQLVADLPRYEIMKTKFDCRREDANRAVEAIKKEFASEKVDMQDGIRIDWDRAWVHARPSNTEPIMRIIAQAPNRATASQKLRRCRRWWTGSSSSWNGPVWSSPGDCRDQAIRGAISGG